MLSSAVRRFLSALNFTAAAESKKAELRRENTGAGYSACSGCRKPILPFSDYWEGEQADYCDGCRPQGVVLIVDAEEKVSVASEAA